MRWKDHVGPMDTTTILYYNIMFLLIISRPTVPKTGSVEYLLFVNTVNIENWHRPITSYINQFGKLLTVVK